MIDKKRDGYLDAMKGMLIILVLIGHFGGDNTGKSEILWAIEYFIYVFQMAVFVFISGFVSKNLDNNQESGFKTLIMYVVFQILWAVISCVLLRSTRTLFNMYIPGPALWYLLALSVWRYYLKDLIRIKHILAVSFIIGGLTVCASELVSVFAIPRIIGFLPFFLLGYYVDTATFERIKKVNSGIGIVILITIFGISLFYVHKSQNFNINILSHNFSYKDMIPGNQSVIKAVIVNYITYALAIIGGIAFLSVGKIFGKCKWLIKIGQRTLSVYILSNYVQDAVSTLQHKFMQGFLTNDYANYLFALVCAAVTLIVLSSDISVKLFDKFTVGIINKVIAEK